MTVETLELVVKVTGADSGAASVRGMGTASREAASGVSSLTGVMAGLGTGMRVADTASRATQASLRALTTNAQAMVRAFASSSLGALPAAIRAAGIAAQTTQAEMRNLGVAIEESIKTSSTLEMRRLGLAMREAMGAAAAQTAEMRTLGVAISEAVKTSSTLEMRRLGTAMREAMGAAAGQAAEMRNLGAAISAAVQKNSALEMQRLGTALRDMGAAARQSQVQMRTFGVAIEQAALAAKNAQFSLAGFFRSASEGAKTAQTATRAYAAENEGASRSVSTLTESLRFMRNILVTMAFFRLFDGALSAVSAFQQIENILRVVVADQSQLVDLMQLVGTTAVSTRSNLEDTARLMYGIAASTKSMGLDWNQIADLTATFQKTTALSGLDTQAARNAMKDFLELLNVGIVQGRQFRALLMQDRPLVDAIASAIHATGTNAEAVNKILDKVRAGGKNISGGSLYELTQKDKGAFTAQDFVKAMQDQTQVSEQFAKTQATVGQQFEVLKTKAMLYFGVLGDGLNANKGLSDAIRYVADNLTGLAEILVAVVGVAAAYFVGIPLARYFIGVGVAAFNSAAAIGVWFATMTGGLILNAAEFGAWVAEQVAGYTLVGAAAATEVGVTAVGAIVSLGAMLIASIPEILAVVAALTVLAGIMYGVGASVIAFMAPMSQLSGFGSLIEGQLNGPFGKVQLTLKDIPTVFEALVNNISTEWPLLTKLVSDMWTDMINSLSNEIDKLANKLANIANRSMQVASGNIGALFGPDSQFVGQNNRPTNTSAGDVAALQKELNNNILRQVWMHNMGLDQGGATGNIGTAKPAGSGTVSNLDLNTKKVKDMTDAILAAKTALADLIGKFGGQSAKFNADVVSMHDKLKALTTAIPGHGTTPGKPAALSADFVKQQFADAGFDDFDKSTLTSAKFTNAMAKEVMGLSHTDIDLANAQKFAADAVAHYGITQDQATEYVKKATIANELQNLSLLHTIQAGEQIATIKFQQSKGTPTDIAEKTTTSALELNQKGSISDYTLQVKALNDLLASGQITNTTYVKSITDIQTAFLSAQSGPLAGFQLGLLDVQKELADTSTLAATAVTNSFKSMEDALVSFATTGKINVKAMTDSIISDFARLAIRQGEQSLLGGLFGAAGTTGGVGSTGGIGGLLGSLIGGGKGAAGGLPGMSGALGPVGASATNPMYVTMVNSTGGIMDSLLGDSGNISGSGGGVGTNPANANGILGSLSSTGGGLLGSVLGPQGLFGGIEGLSSMWGLFGSSGIGSELGSAMGSLFSAIGSLFAFAGGGEFDVGGDSGTDNNLVMFRASHDEHVAVTTPAQQRAAAASGRGGYQRQGDMHLHLHGNGIDVDSFKRSKSQIASGMGTLITHYAQRNS